MLIYKLSREALGDVWLKILRISNGLLRRTTNIAENTLLDKANFTSNKIAINLLIWSTIDEGDEIDEKMSIKAFSFENNYYKITLNNDESQITRCSCV